MPAFVTQLIGSGTAPFMLGIIAGLADATATIMKLVSGWIAQRIYFYKPILIFGYILTPLFVGLIGTARYIWQVALYQIIAWMGKGLREPVRDVWLANVSSAKNYGKIFGMQRAFDSIGAVLGPLIAFYLVRELPVGMCFYFAFVPGFISVAVLIVVTTNYKNILFQERYVHWRSQMKVLPESFINFLSALFIFSIGNFNRTLLVLRAQHMLLGQETSWILATSVSIALYSLLNAIRASAEFGMGALSDYFNRKILLAICGFGFFAIVNGLLLYTSVHLFVWIAIFVIAGISLGTVTSLEKSLAANLLSPSLRGIGFGLQQSLNGVGNLISGLVVGGLWSFFTPESAFFYALVTSVVSCVLLLLVSIHYPASHEDTKKESLSI